MKTLKGSRKRTAGQTNLLHATSTFYTVPSQTSGIPWHILFCVCLPFALALGIWGGYLLRPPTDKELIEQTAQAKEAAKEAKLAAEKAADGAARAESAQKAAEDKWTEAQEEISELKLKLAVADRKPVPEEGDDEEGKDDKGAKEDDKKEDDKKEDDKKEEPKDVDEGLDFLDDGAKKEEKKPEKADDTKPATAAATPKGEKPRIAICEEDWAIDAGEDIDADIGFLSSGTAIQTMGNWKDKKAGVTEEINIAGKKWEVLYKLEPKGSGGHTFKVHVMPAMGSDPITTLDAGRLRSGRKWVKQGGAFYLEVEATNCEYYLKAVSHQ